MEIEKKFLVKQLPDNLENYPHSRMTQSYISRSPVIRLRKIEKESITSFVLTIKSGGLAVRQEFELPLQETDYERLFQKVEGRVLQKVRYLIPLSDGYTAELDIFEGELAGLQLVEVEFPSVEAMDLFEAPDWFGEDVSASAQYHNSVLSNGGNDGR